MVEEVENIHDMSINTTSPDTPVGTFFSSGGATTSVDVDDLIDDWRLFIRLRVWCRRRVDAILR
jgi:hypothetical protein